MSVSQRGAGGLAVAAHRKSGATNNSNSGGSNCNNNNTTATNSPKSGMGKSKYSNFLKLSLPGMGLLRKFQQYRRLPQEAPAHHLEEELDRLTNKIDNLLNRIEGQEQELAANQEEECVVCGTNKATMQTLPCAHKVVCRQCFVRTIQMAVALKRLPLRCILCRAKVLRLKQEGKEENGVPKSVSGYSIAGNNISVSGSNYSFTSGVSAVSSESAASRKSSLSREFSFSSLSNFQNVNLLNKSQIPRSKSGNFGSRRARRSRSPSPAGSTRSRSLEAAPPRIRIDRTPSEECLFPPSPASPSSPGLSPGLPYGRLPTWSGGPRSPRSPTSPTSPISPGDTDRVFSSRGSSRLSTPLSPIKESRKEMGSLAELECSPAKEPLKLQAVPKKPSSRIRCTEQIITQLEGHDLKKKCPTLRRSTEAEVASFDGLEDDSIHTSLIRVKASKSVTFKDC